MVTNSCYFPSSRHRFGNPLACWPGRQLPALKPVAVPAGAPAEAGPGQLPKRREHDATGAARTASRRPGPHNDRTALSRVAVIVWSGERLTPAHRCESSVEQGRGGKSAVSVPGGPVSARLARGPCGRGCPRTTRKHCKARTLRVFVLKASLVLAIVERWGCLLTCQNAGSLSAIDPPLSCSSHISSAVLMSGGISG